MKTIFCWQLRFRLGWFSNRPGTSVDDGARKIKQLAWSMAERQIGHRKSRLVLPARFPVVNWRSCSVAKSITNMPGVACVIKGSNRCPLYYLYGSKTNAKMSTDSTGNLCTIIEHTQCIGYSQGRSSVPPKIVLMNLWIESWIRC